MKKLLTLVLALIMVLGMVSFASADEEITLTFVNQTGNWQECMQPLLDMYYEQTGVKIVQENYSFNDLLNAIEVKVGTGSDEFDILSLDIPMLSSYAYRGMMYDMTDYFSAEDIANLLPAAVEASTFEGRLYASPLATSSQIMYYNTALCEQAGMDMEELASYTVENRCTWEHLAELAAAGQKALDPDGSKGILGIEFAQVDRVYQMNQLPNSMGGAQISEDGFSLDGVINTEPWVKALTWYQDLVKAGISSRGISASEIGDYFYSDKCFFFIGTTEYPVNCEKKGMMTCAWMPSPCFEGYEDKVATPTGSWHFGVSAYSKHPEEAAKFVRWLTCDPVALRTWYDSKETFMAYQPLLDELEADPNTRAHMKIAFYEAAHTAYPRAMTPAFNEYSAVINALWSDVRNGEDVQECIDWAIEEYAAQVQKFQK